MQSAGLRLNLAPNWKGLMLLNSFMVRFFISFSMIFERIAVKKMPLWFFSIFLEPLFLYRVTIITRIQLSGISRLFLMLLRMLVIHEMRFLPAYLKTSGGNMLGSGDLPVWSWCVAVSTSSSVKLTLVQLWERVRHSSRALWDISWYVCSSGAIFRCERRCLNSFTYSFMIASSSNSSTPWFVMTEVLLSPFQSGKSLHLLGRL